MNFWNSFPKTGTWSAASCYFFQRFLEILSKFLLDNKHVIFCLIIPFMTSWTIIYFANDFWMLYVARLITGSVIFIFASSLLVERAGRREHILLISNSVMAVCLGTLAFYFWLKEHGVDVSSYNLIPFVSLGLYISMFALGFGPIPGVTIGQVLSPDVIGLAIGIVCIFASLAQICVVKTCQILLDAARGYELTDVEALKRRFAAVFPPSGVLDSLKPREVAVVDAPRTLDERLGALEDAVKSLSTEFAAFTLNHVLTNQAPTNRAPQIHTTAQTRTVPKSWCYYHGRFGKDARKCSSELCTFSPKISTKNKTFKKTLYTSD
ncbi:uncharacterized protein LOC126549147 [Aphis gossypii]|uniref:uncharacterized protein LOC126549147 n=1 Tax=Aphis gossypii TaxID=80765 RepID=UPI0021597511|nr:uncharacterized protein LOC126549147 [Aphis gossypii]